jgi:nitrite reductase (cytochrome c-552)
MNMATMNEEKEIFLNTLVPQWLEKAEEREANYPVQIN